MPPSLPDRIGKRLRQARTGLGWSMRELAEQSGVSERFVFQVEKGKANASVSKLESLAGAVGLEVWELLQPAEPNPALRRLQRWASGVDAGSVEEACERALASEAGRERRIALLGMRGAGKSTVGDRLANVLEADFIELDARVEERADMPLADIFSMHGPEYYETLEHDCLLQVLDESGPIVLATGGGLVTHRDAFELLMRETSCVWLKAAPRTHWDRVIEQGDRRPMAGNPRAFEQLCTILEEREPLYRRADLVVDTDKHDVDGVVDRVARWATRTA